MRKNTWIKLLSLLLCVGMLLPIATLLPLQSAAAVADGDSDFSSATSKETVYLDGVYYHIEKNVAYKGNSRYSLNIKLQTSLSETDSPLTRVSAKNGCFTAQVKGYYLVELWGGAGADGESSGVGYPGGDGGSAGYVYARVWLEAGQTLAYSIGTNGNTSKSDGDAGGANGTGGEQGSGRFEIGGGGGYSALYFFDEGEFDASWLTADNEWNIPESARLSHYVMIAAGGGGGGAGNGVLYDYATDGNGNKKTADGGAGGNAENGASLTLTGEDYAVPGYIFSGKSGKSSGADTSYVGRGGTNVPGATVTTSGFLVVPSEMRANDWTGTYNLNNAPGAGGAGNYRGGGGGAGYCGGSGGTMFAAGIPQHVGGGGGGSSFLAATVGDKPVAFGKDLPDSVKLHLKGSAGASDITSVGGAFACTYLGDGAGDTVQTPEYLSNVRVEGNISQYFDVVSYYSSDGTSGAAGVPNENGTMLYDAETGVFSVTGVNINSGTMTEKGVALSLTFTIRPKDGFMGGNNVPLLESLKAVITRDEEDHEIRASKQSKTDNVNVPLQFTVKTNSAMYSKDQVTFKGSDLYTAEYTAYNGVSSAPDWGYSFISKVTNYSINEGVYSGTGSITGTAITASQTLTINQTTRYTVSLTVTPVTSDGYADVGPATTGAKIIWGVATIALAKEDRFTPEDGWSYTVTANKTLSYQNGSYIFAQEMEQSYTILDQIGLDDNLNDSFNYTGSEKTSEGYFEVKQNGYYLVQVWGANGGDGGSGRASAQADLSSKINDTGLVRGGSGQAGAALYAYVYLESGDRLTFTMGKAGASGETVEAGVHLNVLGKDADGNTIVTEQHPTGTYGELHTVNPLGGGGGACTVAMLVKGDGTTQYLMIAGGGGGGGGATAGTGDWNVFGSPYSMVKYAGQNGGALPAVTDVLGNLSSYNGVSGRAGDADEAEAVLGIKFGTVTGTVSPGGASGASYMNSAYANVARNADEAIYLSRLSDALVNQNGVTSAQQGGNSAARVTYLCGDGVTDTLDEFNGLEGSGSFSRYFELESDADGYAIDMVFDGVDYNDVVKTVESVASGTEVRYYQDDILIASFVYSITNTPVAGGGVTTAYRVTDTFYYPTFEVKSTQGSSGTKYCQANCGFQLTFRLQPVEGFIGGNDVPLLTEDPGSEYSCVSVRLGEQVGYLSKSDETDYANVEIKYDLDSHFVVYDGYATVNSTSSTAKGTVSTDTMYTLSADLTPPSEEEAWKYAFVNPVIVAPKTEDVTVQASKSGSTTKDLTATILPTVTEPKAVVCANTAGLSITKTATLYVKHPVTYNLTNMTYEGEALALRNGVFTATLTPAEGYLAPASVSVKIGSSTASVTYDPETGLVTIAANKITGPVTITAAGVKQGFDIEYIYEDETGAQHTFSERYEAGATIDYTQYNAITLPEKTGYVYVWEWNTDDEQQPTVMPAYNVLVVGHYEKIRYQLTINYVDSDGNALCDPYTAMVAYGDTYSVTSPTLPSYMASSAVQNGAAVDPFIISGTMGSADVTVTVTYTFAENRLVILYLDKNGNELADRYEATLSENATYAVPSPAVNGYTVKSAYATVSGTLQGKESKTIHVYYDANTYRVDFEYRYEDNSYPGGLSFGSATLEGDAFTTVEFANAYNYNPITGEYGLPTPLMLGYLFEGWYTDTSFTTRVGEQDTVAIPADTVLYAKWTPATYTVTVRYHFVYSEGDFAPQYPAGMILHEDGYCYYQVELPLGAEYDFLVDAIEGYTPYFNFGTAAAVVADRISGKMGAAPAAYDVTYQIRSYTVRFLDVEGQYVTLPEGFAFEAPVFNAEWQTVELTYGKVPVYSGAELGYVWDGTHTGEMYEQYSFLRTEWLCSVTGERYAVGDALPALTADVEAYEFYACYEARENIVRVDTSGGAVKGYFARLQDAVNYAFTMSISSQSSAALLTLLCDVDLRETEIDPTVKLQYSGTRYLKLDLGGYCLQSNTTVFDNNQYLTIYDSVGTGGIFVTAADGVTAIQTTGSTLTLGATVGDANYGVSVEVLAGGGTAIGILGGAITLNTGVVINVGNTGGSAYAVQTSGTLTVNGTGVSISAAGEGETYAIHASRLNNADVGDTQISATSANGDAIGVYTQGFGSSTAYTMHVTATAPGGTATAIKHASTSTLSFGVGSVNYAYEIRAIGKNATALSSTTATSAIYAKMYATSTTGKAIVLSTSNKTATLQPGAVICAVTDSGKAYAFAASKISFATTETLATVTASTNTGEAAVFYNSSVVDTYSLLCEMTATAYAAQGKAYGLYNEAWSDNKLPAIKLSAVAEAGATAYGAYVDTGYLTLSSTLLSAAATGEGGKAYGLYIASGGQLKSASGRIEVTSAQGEAIGIYNRGNVQSVGAEFIVHAYANAYGFVGGSGGSITATATTFAVTVTSDTQNAYGLFADGGNVGAEGLDGSVRYATITAVAENGSSYAFYGANGTVYVRGEGLYYKGSSAQDVQGVVICAGYEEFQYDDTHATRPGYYYLVAGTFRIIFRDVNVENNEVRETVVSYTPERGLLGVEPTSFLCTNPGYAAAWAPYDFSAPASGEEKVVLSVYTPKQFTITVHFNDGANTKQVYTYTYLDAITAPDVYALGLSRAGHKFSGEWYTDAAFAADSRYIFDVMGNADITVYGYWIPVEVVVYFHENGGSAVSPNPVRGEYGDNIPVANPTRGGYAFAGWYTSETLDDASYFGSEFKTVPQTSVHLYAKWVATVNLVVLGDGENIFGEYTVELYYSIDANGNGQIDADECELVDTISFTEGSLGTKNVIEYALIGSMSADTDSGTPALFNRGWKTADGHYVSLTEGVGSWGVEPDDDGVIRLYTELQIYEDAADAYDLVAQSVTDDGNGSYTLMGEKDLSVNVPGMRFDLGGMAITSLAVDGAQGGYVYQTYRAVCTGMHSFATLALLGQTEASYAVLNMQSGEVSEWTSLVMPAPREDILGALEGAEGAESLTKDDFACYEVFLQEGDTLLIRLNMSVAEGEDASSIDLVYTGVQLPISEGEVQLLDIYAMMHNAKEIFCYSLGMEPKKLPVDPQAGYEGVNGWKYVLDLTASEPVLSDRTLAYFNEATLALNEGWFTLGTLSLMILVPTAEFGTSELSGWLGAITSGRYFSPETLLGVMEDQLMGGEGQHMAAIPDNAAASFMLLWYDAVEAGDMQLINAMIASAGKGTLSFASGLPAGTTLTLIDYAPLLLGGYPTYYYYVVGDDEAGICQLALDQFVPVGEALDGENHFVGFSPVMMFNISYANADTTPTTERITLMTEGGVADMTLGLDKAEERVTELSPITAQLGAPMSGYIPLQDLDGRGYAEDDVVLVTMYLKDENGTLVPLPATMDMGGDAVVLNGIVGLPLATVGQINELFDYLGEETYLYPVSIDLDALRYHDFAAKNVKIYIEIVVVPAYVLEFENALSFLGTDTHVDACYAADLYLQAAPQIAFNEKKGSASAGDALTLSTQLGALNDPVTIELYVYQRVGTQMVHTDACDRLLAGYDNVADGISLTSGEMTLQVADSGVDAGVYFLVACYGGNYAVYTLTVTP